MIPKDICKRHRRSIGEIDDLPSNAILFTKVYNVSRRVAERNTESSENFAEEFPIFELLRNDIGRSNPGKLCPAILTGPIFSERIMSESESNECNSYQRVFHCAGATKLCHASSQRLCILSVLDHLPHHYADRLLTKTPNCGWVTLVPVLRGGMRSHKTTTVHPMTGHTTRSNRDDAIDLDSSTSLCPIEVRALLDRCISKARSIRTIASAVNTFGHLAPLTAETRPVDKMLEVPYFPCCRALKENIQPLTEHDDEMELAQDLFDELCGAGVPCSRDAVLSFDKLREATRRRQVVSERALLEALDANLSIQRENECRAPAEDGSLASDSSPRAPLNGISFEDFFRAFQAVPRVRGERLRWAGTLGIEAALARLLLRGDAFDGLRGLRQLDAEAAEAYAREVSDCLSAALPRILEAGLKRLRDAAISGYRSEAQMRANTKFMADRLTVGRFATLEDFYKGPEALIGVPNPRIEEGMRKEHCERDNADTEFKSTNYNVVTHPRLEWELVVSPVPGKAYPHTPRDPASWPADCKWWGSHGREVLGVDKLLQNQRVREMAERVGLRREEAVGLRLYTGPMFILYNAALRGLPQRDVECLRGNRYETTIFVITSGVTKLSKATIVPSNRLLYRGLSGDLVLPDQFWHAHAECTVTLLIRTGNAEAATAAACALASRVEEEDPAFTGGAVSLGRLQGGRLVLPAPETTNPSVYDAPVACASGSQLQASIVLAKVISGDDVRLVVVLPGTRRALQAGTIDRLVQAVRACCSVGQTGGPLEVHVEEVAEKPEGFRGGVELGLLSLSESRSTALRYGGEACGRRGTVFEVQVGRVDIGASIEFLSQYPGEKEYLMPPLSCLEVVGEPRLERTEQSEDIIVVPMRINVNLKSPTVEDLIGRRKLLHAAATKNLREELARSAEERAEVFGALLARRRCGALELLRGVSAHVSFSADGSKPVSFVGRTWATLWAPYLTVSSGRVFFEVEVVSGEGTLGAGFAGTRYSSTVGADVGDDEISWAIFSFDKARHGGRSKKLEKVTGWFVRGAVLGVAADLEKGRMLTCVWLPGDGQDGLPHGSSSWEVVYDAGVGPSHTAGGGLFPILTGGWGASGICNFGHKSTGMRHTPPEEGFLTLAEAIKEELLEVGRGSATDSSNFGCRSHVKKAEEILDGLDVGKNALLRGFDVMRLRHENMPAEDYNDDSIYRDSLDQILTAKVCAERKQSLIVELLESGAAPSQLKVVRDAPASDFQHIKTGKLGSDSECEGYSWRLIFSGWFRFLHTVEVPIDTAPSLIALVFQALLFAGPVLDGTQENHQQPDENCVGLRSVVLGGRKVPMSSLIPTLRLQTTMLHSQRFENALLGLVLIACERENLLRISRSPIGGATSDVVSRPILTDADFRNLEFTQERTLQLASVVVHGHKYGSLCQVNALHVTRPIQRQNLRDCISRANQGAAQGEGYLHRQISALGLGDRLDLIDWGFVMAKAAIGSWTVMNLSHNGIGPVAALGISVGLVSVQSLTELDLSHNCLQSAGMTALSSSLKELTALLQLEIGSNSLRQSGATALAEKLPNLSQLQVLGLADNDFSAAGAMALCKSLSSAFTRLCRLDLSTNSLGHAGGEEMAAVLPSLPSLTVLGLEGQDVGSAVWHVLAGLVPRATSLTVDSGLVTVVCIPLNASLVLNHAQDGKPKPSTVELIRRHALGPDGSRRLANILTAGHSISASRLTEIELSYNGILAEGATALAPALAGLSVLTRLGLTKNNLGLEGARAIAGPLRGLVRLRSLSLEGNSFGAAGWAVLAEVIEDLTCLVSLNGYEGYASLRAGRVSTLEVSGRELAAAVSFLLQRSAATLSVLDISSNSLDACSRGNVDRNIAAQASAAMACRMIVTFGNFHALTFLKISDNALGTAGGAALSEALLRLHCLTALDLSRVDLGSGGAAALSTGFKQLTALRFLGIAGNRIGAAGVASLCDALPSPAGLSLLNLGGNELFVSGAATVAERLGAMSQLETLIAADNGFGSEGGTALSDGLARLGRLNSVDLRGNELSSMGAVAIFRGLMGFSAQQIQNLDLRENGLGEEGGKACAEEIKRLTTLESLILAGNGLGLTGCQAILAALLHCVQLRELDLSENGLGPETGVHLGERLGSLVKLQSVYLEGNRLGPKGVASLIDGLARLSTLRSLVLSDNELGAEGGRVLGQNLSRLTALEVLELEGNALRPEGGTAVALGATALLGLRELSLRDNGLGPDGSRTISELLGSRESLRVDLLWNDLVRRGGGTRQAATHVGLLASTISAVVMRDRRVSISHRQAAIRGSLHKLGKDKSPDDETGWRERLCFVARGKLLYESAKKKGEPEQIAELASIRSVEPLLDEGPPGFYVFKVTADDAGAGRASIFAAASAQDRDRWITALLRLRDTYRAENQQASATPKLVQQLGTSSSHLDG